MAQSLNDADKSTESVISYQSSDLILIVQCFTRLFFSPLNLNHLVCKTALTQLLSLKGVTKEHSGFQQAFGQLPETACDLVVLFQ